MGYEHALAVVKLLGSFTDGYGDDIKLLLSNFSLQVRCCPIPAPK